MLVKLKIFSIVVVIAQYSAAAQIHNRVHFVPEFPNRNQSVTIYYNQDSTIFKDIDKIKCKIFFTGVNEFSEAVRMDFPRVLDLNMIRERGLLSGGLLVPSKATGIVAVFLDSLKEDNNNGEGYWIPVYEGNEPIPGALSGIADLYAGGWDPEYSYHLKRRKDVARKLYEKDFERNPQVKRNFIRYYLATLHINDENDRALFKEELYYYSQNTDLDEWELLNGVSKNYALINEIDSATKYNNLVFERYPNGSWALQTKSLKPAMQVGIEKDYKKMKELYHQFKEMYCISYPDEFTRRIMEGRKGHILQDMVPFFAQHNELDIWQREIDGLDEERKCYAHNGTARTLIDRINSSWKVENETQNGQKHPAQSVSESPLLTYRLLTDNDLSVLAESLSRLAVDWWRKNLDAPRRLIDRPFHSDEEIIAFRKVRLGEFLDHLGQSQLLQNKFMEAHQTLKEAVTLTKRNDALINEHYIEALIKSNQGQEALTEAEAVIRIGKSTAKIDDFHKAISVSHASVKNEAMANLSEVLRNQMINERAPDFILMSEQGKRIDLKEYKNKIIVLDFWATWCPPCVAGLESMSDVVNKYKNESDVVFLFVNTERITEKTKERAIGLFHDKNYVLELFFDPELKTTTSFKVDALPTKIIIDSRGKIRFRQVGLKGDKQEQNDALIAMIELVR